MTRLRRQPPEQMIDIADRLAPYVDLDTDPKRGVRLQTVVADSEAPMEPLAIAV